MNFGRVLQTLSRFLDQHEIPFAVIGGIGLAAYGISRLTIDLDLVTDRSRQNEIISHLESLGYETINRSDGYSNHQHPESAMGGIDVVYIRGETLRAVFAQAQRLQGPGELEILVPSPEHLAAMKVVAMKNDPERALQDLADIRSLMTLPDVDREAIRSQFEKHDLMDRFHDLEKSL